MASEPRVRLKSVLSILKGTISSAVRSALPFATKWGGFPQHFDACDRCFFRFHPCRPRVRCCNKGKRLCGRRRNCNLPYRVFRDLVQALINCHPKVIINNRIYFDLRSVEARATKIPGIRVVEAYGSAYGGCDRGCSGTLFQEETLRRLIHQQLPGTSALARKPTRRFHVSQCRAGERTHKHERTRLRGS